MTDSLLPRNVGTPGVSPSFRSRPTLQLVDHSNPQALHQDSRKLKARSANSIRLQWETKTRDPHARTAIEDVAAVPEMREMREAAGHETDEVRTGVNLMNVQVGPNVMSGVKELEGAEAAIEDRTTDMTTEEFSRSEGAHDDKREHGRYSRRHDSASRSPPRRRRRSPSTSSSSSSSSSSSLPPDTNAPKSASTLRSQRTKGTRQHPAMTVTRLANIQANLKAKNRTRVDIEVQPKIAQMNMLVRNGTVQKRKIGNEKTREREGSLFLVYQNLNTSSAANTVEKAEKEQSSKHKSAISEYGKYGIITEADMFTKDQEFRAWMVEEKMLNPETVSQIKMKDLFKVYMEDFNTATLPHEKFYALEKYEARMNAIRSGNVTAQSDTYDPRADEAALAAQHKRVAKTDGEVYIGRAQLEQLRRIERERVEASRMKRMGMEVKESMGVRYEVD
ncbi:hypothetical protein PSHT_12989 [Puccinia striiformis]|uniref:Uncharacterized protein n=1 Tax=Puccinia striiformis TaxID=27350 RepID=A0A2S4UT11_9BASI|nr:hypothetical protein PSHT_12989 [Puccinia striiformis]